MENDKTISQKVVAVSCEMWSFTRGSDCTILTGKFLVFWICGRLYRAEKWSLTRGEHTWRFDCIQMFKYVSNHEMPSRDLLDICIKALGGYFSISKRYVANKHNDNQRLAALATRLSVRLYMI